MTAKVCKKSFPWLPIRTVFLVVSLVFLDKYTFQEFFFSHLCLANIRNTRLVH